MKQLEKLTGQTAFAEDVALPDIFRRFNDFLSEMRRHEGDSFARSEGDIARHDGGMADPDRDIHPDHGRVEDGGWINSPAEDGEIGKLKDAFIVADAAMNDDAGAGAAAGGGGEIVANEGSIVNLAK